jgi:hypothetical protein
VAPAVAPVSAEAPARIELQPLPEHGSAGDDARAVDPPHAADPPVGDAVDDGPQAVCAWSCRLGVQTWVIDREKAGAGADTVGGAYRLLSAMLSDAVLEGLLVASPCREIDLPKVVKPEARWLTRDEYERIHLALGQRTFRVPRTTRGRSPTRWRRRGRDRLRAVDGLRVADPDDGDLPARGPEGSRARAGCVGDGRGGPWRTCGARRK